MTISTSDGLFDLAKPESRAVFLSDILDMSSREKILRLPVNFDDEETVRLVESWPV